MILRKMGAWSAYFTLILLSAAAGDDDWTKQCNKCKCIWVSGKRAADCTNIGLSSIPTDLSTAIREIDFSNNSIYSLKKNEFKRANMHDIHRLKFQNCHISDFDDMAFSGLALLIELDMSRNNLTKLGRYVFRDNIKLRIVTLSYNRIRVIEDLLFYNMTFLQRILLDNNEIETITPETFSALPSLQHLSLSYNKIKTISFDIKQNLTRLNSLNIEGNPWVCDCHLQVFRKRVMENNLITTPTMCKAPPKLRDRIWSDIEVFACKPSVIEIFPPGPIETEISNLTLSCKVSGEPVPDVDWVHNGRILDRDPRKTKQKFIISRDDLSPTMSWNNLTIINLNYRDRGDYSCRATNPGGEDEKNVSLAIPYGSGGSGAIPLGNSMPLIIGLTITIIVILIIILILFCCYCKRLSNNINHKRRDDSEESDEYIGLQGANDSKKAIVCDVNPKPKPPRATIQGSITTGGTEVSDVKKTLLDNDSVFDVDEECRSLDLKAPLFKKSQTLYNSNYSLSQPYPPDLLSFPPRAAQGSPAGSSASTVAMDHVRCMPAHHGPQSPLHSPMFETMSLYSTLPLRSHSPFVGPQPRVPRMGQGYVTIPRRPRQSWSSEPPGGAELSDPIYDNLGLRTTINGSSAQSLNKLTGDTSTPKQNRFPISPIDPIAEHEPPPPTQTQTLPRLNQKLSPSRTNWAKQNAEALRSPEKRNSTTSLPSTDNPAKIPPRPPPKPKKRVSAGPLFEDEGEDGTEV